jgi:hypothetical protein
VFKPTHAACNLGQHRLLIEEQGATQPHIECFNIYACTSVVLFIIVWVHQGMFCVTVKNSKSSIHKHNMMSISLDTTFLCFDDGDAGGAQQ